MKRALGVGAVALAVSAGVATVAGGQSGGAPESGTFTYEIVTKFNSEPSPTSNPGVNPARPRDPDRQNAGDIQAFNYRIVTDGKATGRGHAVRTWTRLGRGRQARGEGSIIQAVDDFGGADTLAYTGVLVGSPRNIPLAVTGGTGRFAGADGTVMVEVISFKEKTLTLREKITVTFTP